MGPAVALAVAALVGGGLVLLDDDPTSTAAETGSEPGAVTPITSDAPRFEHLAALVGASDLVVRGTILAVDPGRVFGEPGQAAIRSRLVTVRIDEVLSGAAGGPVAGRSLVVEEPGWLDDGTPIEVDGVPGSTAGTAVIWFLQAVEPIAADGGAGPATYVLTGPQGHYRAHDEVVVGADGPDPLIAELEGLGTAELTAAIRAVVRPSPA